MKTVHFTEITRLLSSYDLHVRDDIYVNLCK